MWKTLRTLIVLSEAIYPKAIRFRPNTLITFMIRCQEWISCYSIKLPSMIWLKKSAQIMLKNEVGWMKHISCMFTLLIKAQISLQGFMINIKIPRTRQLGTWRQTWRELSRRSRNLTLVCIGFMTWLEVLFMPMIKNLWLMCILYLSAWKGFKSFESRIS